MDSRVTGQVSLRAGRYACVRCGEAEVEVESGVIMPSCRTCVATTVWVRPAAAFAPAARPGLVRAEPRFALASRCA